MVDEHNNLIKKVSSEMVHTAGRARMVDMHGIPKLK